MKKVLGAAIIAALVGSTVANAMDYRIGVQVKTDGGWSPFQYRYLDYSDEKAAEAHVLESNGEAVAYNNGSYTAAVGDQQILGSYAGAYEDGFALWAGGRKGFRFQPMFQGASNSGDWKFGARFMVKCKEYDNFAGNGWSAWAGYKNFELKTATTGGLGYGAYVGTGGNFLLATSALYAWLMTDTNYAYFKHYKKGNIDDYNYFGYQVSNAGLGVENVSDKAMGVGVQWTGKVRNDKDTLNIRLANMHNFASGGFGYIGGREYDAKYPMGWNAQVNYRMPSWTFSTTFKMRGANEAQTSDKFEKADAWNIAGHFGVSTALIPGVSLSAGYAFIGEDIGKSAETEVNGTAYSHEFWGHNFGVAAGWKIGDWSFSAGNTTTLMLLSDYMKAKSSAYRYAWKPYLGTTVYVNTTKRINGLMTGHLNFSFTDANLNSYTDGKAEASFSFVPNVDISPARGVNVNIGIACSLENFSDRACGWWSDYNSDSDFGNSAGEIYYTYPHTLTISVPISMSLFI